MLTIEDIAKELKVNPRTVYRWISQGKLKALKIQGIIRITEEDYQQFISQEKLNS